MSTHRNTSRQLTDAFIAGTASVEQLATRLTAARQHAPAASAVRSSSQLAAQHKHACPQTRGKVPQTKPASTPVQTTADTCQQSAYGSLPPEQLLRAARCLDFTAPSNASACTTAQTSTQHVTADSGEAPQPRPYLGIKPRLLSGQHDARPSQQQIQQHRLQLAQHCSRQQQLPRNASISPAAAKSRSGRVDNRSSPQRSKSPSAASPQYSPAPSAKNSSTAAAAAALSHKTQQARTGSTSQSGQALEGRHSIFPAAADADASATITRKLPAKNLEGSRTSLQGGRKLQQQGQLQQSVQQPVSHLSCSSSPIRSSSPKFAGEQLQHLQHPGKSAQQVGADQQQGHSLPLSQHDPEPEQSSQARLQPQQLQQQHKLGLQQPPKPVGWRSQQHEQGLQQSPAGGQEVFSKLEQQESQQIQQVDGSIQQAKQQPKQEQVYPTLQLSQTLSPRAHRLLRASLDLQLHSKGQDHRQQAGQQQQHVTQQQQLVVGACRQLVPVQQKVILHQQLPCVSAHILLQGPVQQHHQQQQEPEQQQQQQQEQQGLLDPGSLLEQRIRVAAACAKQHVYSKAPAVIASTRQQQSQALQKHQKQQQDSRQQSPLQQQLQRQRQRRQEEDRSQQSQQGQQTGPLPEEQQQQQQATAAEGSAAPRDKQQLLLAKICAKHGLPLPQQGSHNQQQRQQHLQKLAAQQQQLPGKQMHDRRQQLLLQLRAGQQQGQSKEALYEARLALGANAAAAEGGGGAGAASPNSRRELRSCSSPIKQGPNNHLGTNSSRGNQQEQQWLSQVRPASSPLRRSPKQPTQELLSDKGVGRTAAAAAAAAAAEQGLVEFGQPAIAVVCQQIDQLACHAALDQLHAATTSEPPPNAAAAAEAGLGVNSQQRHMPAVLPVMHALAIWGLGLMQPGEPTSAAGVDGPAPSAMAQLHAVLQMYLISARMEPTTQQKQKQQFKCQSLQLVSIHALHAIVTERRASQLQQQLSTTRCLQQVSRSLWHQQALAQHKQNPNTSNSQNPNPPHRPPFVAVSATAGCCSSNKYFAQHCSQLQLPQQRQQKQGGLDKLDKPVAVSAAVLTKWLSNLSAVLAEKVDVEGLVTGWAGSELVVRLLKELYQKLLCKLALQALRAAAIVAADLDVLLQHQRQKALQMLYTSTAFASWHRQAAAAVTSRSRCRKARQAVQRLRSRQILTGWSILAQQRSRSRAVVQLMLDRRRSVVLVQCFRSWSSILAQSKYRSAQAAVAVQWHARVLLSKVVCAWAAAAKRAAAIKAAADGSSSRADPMFLGCSMDLATARQQQWKAAALTSMAAAGDKVAAAEAAADAAAGQVRGRLPDAAAAAAELLGHWQQQRQDRAAVTLKMMAQAEQALSQLERGSLSRADSGSSASSSSSSSVSDVANTPASHKVQQGKRLCGDPKQLPRLNSTAQGSSLEPCNGEVWQASTAARSLQPDIKQEAVVPEQMFKPPQPLPQQQQQTGRGAQQASVEHHKGQLQKADTASHSDSKPDCSDPRSWIAPEHTLDTRFVVSNAAGPPHTQPSGVLDGNSLRVYNSLPTGHQPQQQQQQSAQLEGQLSMSNLPVAPAGFGSSSSSEGGSFGINSQQGSSLLVQAGASRLGVQGFRTDTLTKAGLVNTGGTAAVADAATADKAVDTGVGLNVELGLSQHAGDPGCGSHSPLVDSRRSSSSASGGGVPDKVPAVLSGGPVADADGLHRANPQLGEDLDPLHHTGMHQSNPLLAYSISKTHSPRAAPQLPDLHAGRDHRSARRVTQAIEGYAARSLCKKALQGFRDHVAAVQQQLAAADLVYRAVLGAGVVQGWLSVVAETQVMLNQHMLRCCYRRWRRFKVDQLHKQQATAVAAQHRDHRLLVKAFRGWQHYNQHQQHLDQQLEVFMQWRQHRLLVGWRAAAAKSACNNHLIHQARMQHLCKILRFWRRQAADVTNEVQSINQYQRMLIRRCFAQWVWPVRGRALLTRVFAQADQAWTIRDRQQKSWGQPGVTHAQNFALMQLTFHRWLAYTGAQLQLAAARAAEATAAVFSRTKLLARAWQSWQLLLHAAAEQQRLQALAACSFGCWLQHVREQKQICNSLLSLRKVLQKHQCTSRAPCRTEQQWYRHKLVAKAYKAWMHRVLELPYQHCRQQQLAKGLQGLRLAVHETALLMLPFWAKWQQQRLLQKSFVLWRGLVLLMQQQRSDTAAVDCWRDSRLAARALAAWLEYTALAVVKRNQCMAAYQHYHESLLRRMLLHWSLVICASSAARIYYQRVLVRKVLVTWRGAVAAVHTALAQAAELQQLVEQMKVPLHSTMQGQNAAAPGAGLAKQQKLQQQQWVCCPASGGGAAAAAAAAAGSKLHEGLAAGGHPQQQYQIPVAPQVKCSDCQQQQDPVVAVRSHAVQASQKHVPVQHGADTAVVYCSHPVYEIMTDCTNTVHLSCGSYLNPKQQQTAGSSDGGALVGFKSHRVGSKAPSNTHHWSSSPTAAAGEAASAGVAKYDLDRASQKSSRMYVGQRAKDSAEAAAVRAAADAAISGNIGCTHRRAAAVCSTAAPAL